MYIRVALGAFLLLHPFVSFSSQNIFKNDLDESFWLFSGNAHQCRLSQDVDGFGLVSLIADAGEPLVFNMQSNDIDGSLTFQGVQATPASWDRFEPYSLSPLGAVTVSSLTGEVLIEEAAPILDALYQGDWVHIGLMQADKPLTVAVSNVRFPTAVTDFLDCKNQLLPMGYRQVRDSTFYLSPNAATLTAEEWHRIDGIARYIRSQNTIKAVLVDGYMNSNARSSVKLRQSKDIADEVASLFVEKGIAPALIEVRAHGGRYPQDENQPAGKGRVRVRIVQL